MCPSHNPQDNALVGVIVGSHGTHGETKVQSHSDNPRRFLSGNTLISNGETLTIESSRQNKGHIIVKFEGVNSMDHAKTLIGRSLEIPIKSISRLEPDNYYHYEIIGLNVWTSDSRYIGTVVEILTTGSNDVYIARETEKDILIPALKHVIKNVNLEHAYMVVELPDGL